MIKLYQFPLSHYCEKIRWSLDYKGLSYQTKNLLPGLHVGAIRKLTLQTSVPVLTNGKKSLHDSARIIDYLDQHYPDKLLTPSEECDAQAALKWEKFADEEIGPSVRLLCYNILLNHPDAVIALFSHGGPWYGKFVMKLSFNKLESKMRSFMKINDRTAGICRKRLHKAVAKLQGQLDTEKYLVAGKFSRADLATASLLAPFFTPEKYGNLPWPDPMPAQLVDLTNEFSAIGEWVESMYCLHR